jgi:hypothetical protein
MQPAMRHTQQTTYNKQLTCSCCLCCCQCCLLLSSQLLPSQDELQRSSKTLLQLLTTCRSSTAEKQEYISVRSQYNAICRHQISAKDTLMASAEDNDGNAIQQRKQPLQCTVQAPDHTVQKTMTAL